MERRNLQPQAGQHGRQLRQHAEHRSRIAPQGTDDSEVTFWFAHDNDAHATYDILDAQGAKTGTYTADMTVYSGAGATTSRAASAWATAPQIRHKIENPGNRPIR